MRPVGSFFQNGDAVWVVGDCGRRQLASLCRGGVVACLLMMARARLGSFFHFWEGDVGRSGGYVFGFVL